MQGPQPIPVYRPTEITDGPEFQPFLVESPANIFYQQVNASRATLDRMQFQWRSVSDNLLLSPTMRPGGSWEDTLQVHMHTHPPWWGCGSPPPAASRPPAAPGTPVALHQPVPPLVPGGMILCVVTTVRLY